MCKYKKREKISSKEEAWLCIHNTSGVQTEETDGLCVSKERS